MYNYDFNRPHGIIDLKKKLTIKEIKYILENLGQDESEYNYAKKLMESVGAKDYPYVDYESINALQILFKYCNNKVFLCKLANVFNRYVKVHEDIGFYESLYGEDKMYSCGYDVRPNFPKELKEKILSFSKKVYEKALEEYREFYR